MKDLVAVGKVLSTHGRAGEVKVEPLTDHTRRFSLLERAYLKLEQGELLEVGIEEVRYHKNFVLIKFESFNDIDEALKLKDALIMIERKDILKLPEDHYYIFDILGLKVYAEDGAYLGTIKGVMETGSNDVYEVEKDEGSWLLPAIKDVIKKIDIEREEMIIRPLAGLFEED